MMRARSAVLCEEATFHASHSQSSPRCVSVDVLFFISFFFYESWDRLRQKGRTALSALGKKECHQLSKLPLWNSYLCFLVFQLPMFSLSHTEILESVLEHFHHDFLEGGRVDQCNFSQSNVCNIPRVSPRSRVRRFFCFFCFFLFTHDMSVNICLLKTSFLLSLD